jgi:hypothetical protein
MVNLKGLRLLSGALSGARGSSQTVYGGFLWRCTRLAGTVGGQAYVRRGGQSLDQERQIGRASDPGTCFNLSVTTAVAG